MNITKNEYKALKKYYKSEYLTVSSDVSKELSRKGLIEQYEVIDRIKGRNKYSDKLRITAEGRICYEHFHKTHRKEFFNSVRSWIAIIISLIALIKSFTN